MQYRKRCTHMGRSSNFFNAEAQRRRGAEMQRRLLCRCVACIIAAFLLAGCINRPLLSNVQASADVLQPTSNSQTIDIAYTIGCNARVSIYLQDDNGQRYQLRQDEPRSAIQEPYTLRFDGTVPTDDPVYQRRLLPSGDYTAFVQAESDECGDAQQQLPITIAGSDVPLPDVENLVVWPSTISPNADAIDDIAQITYRLPVTATVDISITTPNGDTFPLLTRAEETPAEWSHIWDGKRPDGALLPNGVYTCTVKAEDHYGNLSRRQQPIALENVGDPEATITYARIAPEHIMLGNVITITMRVKNTGTVPIRTYGPPSGFTYTTDDVFSSIANGRYTSHAGGFWRIGVDWDANSGGGAKRYPFRWALSERPPEQWKIPGKEDWLLPGEEVTVLGHVMIQQRERKMGFYVGLIQDGVGFFQDRTARTIVEVGF